MNFEQLQQAWAEQSAPAPAIDVRQLERIAHVSRHRRGRLLAYTAGITGFALVVDPVLAVANYRFLHPAWPIAFWLNVAVHVIILLAVLVFVLRRMARHRALCRRSTASVREFAAVALAGLEAETRDLRVAAASIPVFAGLGLLSGYLNHVGRYGWSLFATQAAIIIAIVVPVAWAAWRDYRVNVQPGKARLRRILDDADAAG